MKWDEDKFGLEYDLDIFNVVAVNDFNMGAMENKGLNVFNTAFVLAKPGAARTRLTTNPQLFNTPCFFVLQRAKERQTDPHDGVRGGVR